jgi:hypothetical protein
MISGGFNRSLPGFDTPANCQINASVAGNALTIAIVGNNGQALSATNPLVIAFRDTVLTNGDPVFAIATAPVTTTIASGSTLGTTSGMPFRLWLTAINNNGTILLGVSLQGTTARIAPLMEDILQTTGTGINGGNLSGVIYTSVASLSNVAVRIIGYLEWSAGLVTAGTWATGPTKVQLFGPGIKKPGDVIQTVWNTSSVAYTGISGNSWEDINNTNYQIPITPTSTINGIMVNMSGDVNGAAGEGFVTRVGRSGAIAATIYGGQTNYASGGSTIMPLSVWCFDFPATIAAQKYTLQMAAGANGYTNYYNESSNYAGTINFSAQAQEIMM